MFTLQPEEIKYVVSSISPQSISSDNDEGICENRVEFILENGIHFVYQNLPFTITKNNQQITALDVNVGDMLDSMKQQDKKGNYLDVVLHYYAIKQTDIPELGTSIDVQIESPIIINFGEKEGHNTIYKNYSVQGHYIIKEIEYESTIMGTEEEPVLDAKITMTKVKDFGGDETEEEFSEENLLTMLNPIDRDIQVQVYLTHIGYFNIVFAGKLVDMTESSARAMGREIELAEKLVKVNYNSYDTYLYPMFGNIQTPSWKAMVNIEDVLEVITRKAPELFYNKDYELDYGDEWGVGHFHHGNAFDSFSFMNMSVWEVLVKVASTYGYFLTVEYGSPSIIHLHTEGKMSNGSLIYNGQIPSSSIESRKVQFRGNQSYTGVEITGNFASFNNTWDSRYYTIQCYNQSIRAGKGIDFGSNLEIDTDEIISDRTSFNCVAIDIPEGASVMAKEGRIDYIKNSISPPEGFDAEDYRSTVTISMRPELVSRIRFLRRVTVDGGDSSVGFIAKPLYDAYDSQSGYTATGEYYVDIFGDYENLEGFTIRFPMKTPKYLSLLQGYFIRGEEGNLFIHRAELMQGPPDSALERMADYLLERENAKLQYITLKVNGFFETKPSDVWGYEYRDNNPESIVVENCSFSFDKNLHVTTQIEGYSYVWPI